MAFDDSLIGSNDFDPRAATESLIRQVSDIPPGGPVDARVLATRLARKLGTEATSESPETVPLPKARPAEADAPPPVPRRKAPPPTVGPLDFSAQAVPPSPTDGTNTGLDFSGQAAEAVPLPVPRPPGAPQPPETSLSDYPIEFGKGALEGGKNMGAAALKGIAGAGIPSVADPALLDDLTRAPTMSPKERAAVMSKVLTTVNDRGLQMDYNAALRRVSQGGDPAVEIAQLKPKFNPTATAASTPGAFSRGFVTGMLKENPENMAEALEGLGHLAPDDFRESLHSASKQVHDLSKLSPEAYKKRSGSMWDIKGIDDALTWAGETVGSGVASTVPSVAMGVAGGVVGGRVAGRPGAVVGAMGGAAVPSAVQNYGELYKSLKDEKVDPKAAAEYAAYATPALVALDTASIGPIITRLGGIKVVKEELARGIAKRIAVEAAKGTGREGITEALQQVVEEATVSLAADKPFWTVETGKKVLEAGVGGALTGGAMGGASGIKSDTVQSQPGLAPPPAGSASGLTAGAAPGSGGERSSPEDIADFVRQAKEGAPSPEPGPPPGPDPMSEAERQRAYTASRESHGGASETDILKAAGLDPATMNEQERVDAVIRAAKPADATGNATGNAQAEPEAQPKQEAGSEPETSHLRYATLREYGYSDEDIDNMSPAQRKRDFDDAVASGVKPGQAMSKHPKRAPQAAPEQPANSPGATTSESDVGDGTRAAPIRPQTAQDVQKAQAAEPTPAQAEAGNYKHAHMELPQFGLTGKRRISIETGQGQERKGVGADGKPWSVKLDHAAYGRLLDTKGADGEHLDAFIGPHPTSSHVFVVDQHHPGAGFDEHKIMLGFRNPIEALHAYAHAYNDMGKDRIGHVTAMGPDEFKAWLAGDTTKALKPPASEPVKAEAGGPAFTEVATAAGTPKETPTGPGAESGGSALSTQKPAKRSNEPTSLLQFIAGKGGLAPHPELDALDIGDHRAQIPGRKGFFGVVRPTGMSLDMMREAAEEAGYFRGEHNKTSTIRNFLDAIDNELRGHRHHAEGEEGKKNKRQRTSEAESSAAARDKAVAAAYDDIAAEYADLPPDLHAKAADIMADERLDVDSAVEQAAVRMVSEDPDFQITADDITATYGEGTFDEIRPRQASEDGGPAAPAGGQEQRPGEGQEAGQHGERVSDAGAERGEVQSESTEAGDQQVIPGAERIGHGEQAQRSADKPLKPKKAQKAADEGLFSDEKDQGDLLDTMSRKVPVDDKLNSLLEDEGYKLETNEHGFRAYIHDEDAGTEQVRRVANLAKSQGFTESHGLRGFKNPETGEVINMEPGGEDTSGHYLFVGKETAPRGEPLIDLDGATAEIQAGDSDETVTVTLSRKGPWDFNDTWPAPDMQVIAASAAEGRSFFDEGQPDVEQVVAMLDEGMNAITSAIAEIRAIDSRIADIRSGKTKLKKRQTPEQAIDVLQRDRGRYAAEVRDTAEAHEELFGRPAANAMIAESRRRLRNEENASPGERQRAPLDAIETALGEDADKVAPVDIARAAEIMAESPGMEPTTAFGQAVIENAVDHGFITEPEAIEAYGEEVKDILDAGRQGASERSGGAEQERAASGEVGPGGAAQAGVVPGRGEAGDQSEGGTDSEGAIPATSGTAASGSEAAGDQASDTAADRPAAESADQPGKLNFFGVFVPDGYEVQGPSEVPEAFVHQYGGKLSAVATRLHPWSAEKGYGDTPEAAQRDALRRLGVEPTLQAGGPDGQNNARNERDARARGLEDNEGALPGSAAGARMLRGSDGLPRVAGQLPDVPAGHGTEAGAGLLNRAPARDRGLSSEQLRVGDENGAVPQSAGLRAAADLSGQDATRRRVGGRAGDQGQDAIPATSDRLVGGEDTRNAVANIGGDGGVQIAVHAGDAPAGAEDVQPAEPGGQAAGVRGRKGSGSKQAVPRTDSERTEGSGRVSEGAARERSDRAGDGRDAGLSEPRADDAADGRAQRADERAADHVEGENFTIEPGALDEGRSFLTKARDNIKAITTAKVIEAEGRPATRAEQELLARYVGWGGIKGAFADTDGAFGKGYETVGEQLKALLDPTEYETARRSIQYAHYTAEDVVRSMWAAVTKMGFAEGQVFEPGMGVGNFAGMMPTDVAANTQYSGLELDHTTARIAKLLYPKWGVRQDDFTKAPLPENNYDLVIGNPPFADVAIKSDPKYKQGFLLHDYFFAKSIDAVRPGGLLAFVSSAGTMNKIDASAREYLADRADLVGAIRLPGNAFAKNAGTEVTTDIVFLRKRLPGDIEGDRTWTETVPVTLPNSDGMKISGNMNRYFADHPEMVLGEHGFFDKLYKNRYAVRARPGSDIKADLAKAIESLPADVMSPWQNVNSDHTEQDFGSTEKKEGTYYIGPDESLHQVSSGVGRKVGQRGKGVENGRTAADMERIKALIPVRDALRAVYSADLAGDTANADRARAQLNKTYDAFVAAFGPINKSVIQTRRPNVIQMEGARAEAREEARYANVFFREGSFDATPLLDAKTPLSVIARKRQEARDEAKAKYQEFDEGDFDPDEVPDVIIDKRPNVDPFMDDPESYRLRAIERYDEGTGKGHKSPVFSENVISREVVPKISSVNDALLYSLSQYGRVNVAAMAELSKKSESEVIEALGDQVFKVPGTKDVYQTRDEYLSGDVRKKLALAETAASKNPEFRRNLAALEAAQPVPLAPSQIHATLGMPWIPADVVKEFGIKELGLSALKVRYIKALAQWHVSGDTDSVSASTTWGTNDRRAPALLQDALNRQSVKIYDKINVEGREQSILNITKTEAAQDKVRAMQEKFTGWIWSDQARADRLAGFYNENFNNLVVREYNGDYLTTPGIATSWNWRPHQKRVIARIIQSGNTYVAHAVGGGKTSEYIGAIMEMRRLGLVRKPMVAVPNHMLAQFTKEWYEQYPTARLAIADDKRFHTDRRKQFIANVAMEDLDAIIITHSSFGMIPVSAEFQNSIIQREIGQYRDLLADLQGGDNRITRSRVEKQIERLEQRLIGRGTGRKDSVFTFEEMGIDHLTIDEAHLFRKLDFSTNMSNLKGVSPEGSGMAWDLYVKSLYLDSIRPGRSLVMGSGTPITNTMAELYTVSRFMQPQALAERGLEKFDAWAGAFGESVSELEQDAAGNYKPVSRFAKFVNVAELSAMVRQVMDVVTSKQLEQYVTRPQIKGGKRKLHLAEKSRALIRYQEDLAARMKAIQNRKGPPKKGDDIMLSVINDGRHAAIDMRLAGGVASNEPSKLDLMVDNLYQTWERSKKQPFHKVKDGGGYEDKPFMSGPATQLAFVNLGLSGIRGFSVPDYIRAELVRRGIPKNEIAYIYDYKSATAKQRLFNDMNEGKVRVLMGSVAKMGVGTNVQKRLLAIHNMDPLWYPADDEQRNGRGIRQGNMNPEIAINDYATKGTYDSTMWGMMEKKARFIQGFFEGDPSMRDMDDLGEASQYEQAKAMTTNDPRLIRFTELKQELEKANRRKTAFDSEVYHTRQRRARAESEIEHYSERVIDTAKDIAQRVDTRGDAFKASIGKETFDKRVNFGEALFAKLESLEAKGTLGGAVKVAEVGGFPVYAEVRRSQLLKDQVSTDVFMGLNGAKQTREISYDVSPLGTVRSIESILGGFEHDLEEYKARLARAQKFYEESEAKAKAKFDGDAEIAALTQQVDAMAAELAKPIETTERAAPESTEEGEALASLTDMAGLTPEAQQSTAEISAMLRKIVGKIAGDVPMEFHAGMIPMEPPKGYPSDLTPQAGGVYHLGSSLVRLALLSDANRMAKSAFHESYHHIEDKLQTPQERRLMASETQRLRERIKGTTQLSDEQVDKLAGYEVRAIAFQNYAHDRATNKPQAGGGLHLGVRIWFGRLLDLLSKIRNALRGMGFKSYEDVFNDAYEGTYAGREPGKGGIDPNEPLAAMAGATGPGGGRRGPPSVNETIAQHLEDRNFNRLAKISRALGLGKINTTELRVQLQDKFIRVRDTERMVDPDLPSSQSAYQAESLYYGRTGEQLEQLERDHFDPLITDMKARGIDLEGVNEYLYAKHAPERNRRMDEINHPELDPGGRDLRGRGSGMSDDEAMAILDRLTAEGKIADYEAVERRIRTILDNTRNGLVDSGIISQATADAWAAQYEFYVPLRGFEEGTEDEAMSGRGAGFDTRARETQQAFGRLSKAAGPLPYIMQQAEMAIVRGEKNRVGNAWLRFVRSHPMPDRWTVDTPPTRKAIDKRTGLVTTVEDAFWHLKPDIFVTKIGGKPVLIQMKGKDGENVVRALKNMGTSNLNSVLRFMNTLTSTMSRLATQWNPNFTLPNFARDVGEAFINLQAQDQATFVKRFSKHLFPAIKGSFHALRGAPGGVYGDAFREFDKAGGRIRFFGLENHDDVEKNINIRLRRLEGGAINNIRAAGEAAAMAFEIVNGAIENATRLAAFMAARDVGMSTPDAAMLARNLTVDFNKKGELGSAINALYMFANASIQGTVRTASAMTNKRVRRAAYLLAVAGALGALANLLGGGDDDDGDSYYSKIKPYIRDKNLIIMWPKGFGHDGQYVKIPLPYGFSPFHVLGDRLAGVALGKDKPVAAAWAVLASIAEAFNPLGEESATMLSVLPSVFRPAAHIQTNKNWNGNPIYPTRDFEKNKPDSEQSFRSNSAFAKEAARDINKATGGSPYKSGWADWHPGSIDHVMESLTGGLGKFVKDVIFTGTGIYKGDPFDATKAPILRRFVGSVKDPAVAEASYFESREEARKNGGDAIKNARKDRARGINTDDAESFLKNNTNSVRGEQIFKSADKAMKPLRDRKERIEANTALDADEKRKQLADITEQMRRIQIGARKQYLELSRGAASP